MASTTESVDRIGRMALNQIRGVQPITIIGERFNLPAFSESMVWDGPVANYVFTDYTTDRINRISSSSTLDIGKQIRITGLDENWMETTQIRTLNGQNKVNLNPELIRINRAMALNNLNGEVFIYEDGSITGGKPNDLTNVKGYINFENNITQQSFYSVPLGFFAQFKKGNFSAVPSAACCMRMKGMVRYFGGALIKAFSQASPDGGTTFVALQPATTIIYPEKSDIYILVQTTAAGAGINLYLDWELIRA